ncbi:MAG TPA: hypothetical protein VGR86_11395 [Steroidobacteraceae bacterium]|nr:hypothetical protein [Steroidobacteraceae bacterium]
MKTIVNSLQGCLRPVRKGEQAMLRNKLIVSDSVQRNATITAVALVLLFVFSFASIPVASATTTTGFQFSGQWDYTCNPPDCSQAFTEDGVVRGTFGTMKLTDTGTVTGGPDANGCFTQDITYTFTTKNPEGSSLVLDTPHNVFCPTADPNVWTVTINFSIIGGTGQFAGATGSGSALIVFRIHPQTAEGVFTGTVIQ